MKKLLTNALCALALVVSFSSISFAQTIENTGPGSTNEITVGEECTIEVDNNTDIDINIDNDQDAGSGDATNDGNTNGGGAGSGDANNDNNVVIGIGVDNGSDGVSCEPVAATTDPETPTDPTGPKDPSNPVPQVLGENDVNVGGGDIAALADTNAFNPISLLAITLGTIAVVSVAARRLRSNQ